MRDRRRARLATSAVLLAAGLSLSACGSDERFPPACPSLAILPDAADLTRYGPGGQDITDLVVDARITAIPAKCQAEEPGKVSANIRISMAAQRGPAATDRKVTLPYFVAVTEGERILDKQDYTLVVEFAANANQALPTTPEIDLILPVTKAKSAAAYGIFVGYTLTPEELAINRKRGPR